MIIVLTSTVFWWYRFSSWCSWWQADRRTKIVRVPFWFLGSTLWWQDRGVRMLCGKNRRVNSDESFCFHSNFYRDTHRYWESIRPARWKAWIVHEMKKRVQRFTRGCATATSLYCAFNFFQSFFPPFIFPPIVHINTGFVNDI